jgi:hypothetical protein
MALNLDDLNRRVEKVLPGFPGLQWNAKAMELQVKVWSKSRKELVTAYLTYKDICDMDRKAKSDEEMLVLLTDALISRVRAAQK